MVSVGVEVTLLAQIHLIVEAKFGSYPWTLLSDRDVLVKKKNLRNLIWKINSSAFIF